MIIIFRKQLRPYFLAQDW